MPSTEPRDPGTPPWWCALPDTAAAGPVASALRAVGTVAARHHSGRPWLIAASATPPPRVHRQGDRAVAVIGAALPASLSPAEAVQTWMRAVGSAHVVTSEPGRVRAMTDAAGFRRVFTARAGGVSVAASHATILRRLIDAPIDRSWVAAKMASPDIPSVVRQSRSPFVGISSVPAGCVAELTDGRVQARPWWHPPTPQLPLAYGARLLRDALTRAVQARADAAQGKVSVQLSGGLDSVALALLAAQAEPLMVTTAGFSPVDEDLTWARRVAKEIPAGEHQIFTAEQAPLFFSELDRPLGGLDEPCSFTAGAARQRFTAATLARRQVGLHLNGQGGDEVLLAPWAFLPGLVRREPRRGWRSLRGFAALSGLRTPTVLHAALRPPGSFSGWLERAGRGLGNEADCADAALGWEAFPLLPGWASAEAAELAATAIAQAEPTPAHPDVAVHAAVVRVRASAYRAALYADAMAAAGVPTAMPFFDHDVLTACLSTRPEERTDPWTPKPLLRTALRHDVPPDLVSRRTKGHYNTDIHRGWSAHREQVLDLLADSRLARLGLLNTRAARAQLAVFGPSGLPPAFVTDLVALEAWLRDQPPSLTWGDR